MHIIYGTVVYHWVIKYHNYNLFYYASDYIKRHNGKVAFRNRIVFRLGNLVLYNMDKGKS